MTSTDPTENDASRPCLPGASLCVFAAAVVAVLCRVPMIWQGRDLFCDDAYYYLVTASNFVETGRFTFDGLSQTNGFHPLLFWLEAAALAVFGTPSDPMRLYWGACCAMGALFLLTIAGSLQAVHTQARFEGDAPARHALLLTLCVVLLPRFTTPYLGGMESILVLPLLLALGVLAWERRYGFAGIVALLLVMARLDMAPYVVGPISAACVWRERHRGWAAFQSGFHVALPPLLGTLLLMGWHQWYFGHPVPIHGVLKSCFPRIHFQGGNVFSMTAQSITPAYALLAAVSGAGLLLRGRGCSKEACRLGLAAAAVALLQLAAFTLFQKWSKPIPVWYVGPAVLAGTFALTVGVVNTIGLRWMRPLTLVAGMAVLAINLAAAARGWDSQWWTTPSGPKTPVATLPAEIVEFMKTKPADRIWACTDCGKLAFWSERPVVNLDGLVNDFEYQKALRDKRLGEYLVARNVRYLVFLVWDRPQTDHGSYEPMYDCRVAPDLFKGNYRWADFHVVSYQYMTHSDIVRLPREAEVWRSTPTPDGNAMGRAVIFDLDVALRRVARP